MNLSVTYGCRCLLPSSPHLLCDPRLTVLPVLDREVQETEPWVGTKYVAATLSFSSFGRQCLPCKRDSEKYLHCREKVGSDLDGSFACAPGLEKETEEGLSRTAFVGLG